MLLITHNLEGLDQADEIVVLDCGRLAERGSHDRLIELGGVYHRLWQAQLRQEERRRRSTWGSVTRPVTRTVT
jgi:ABC-type multidrug transport system fused ATPase/permease subunit